MSFKHNFTKAGKEWTADMNFNKSRNENNNFLTTTNYATYNGTLLRSFKQVLAGGGENQFLTLQTDYVDPITANSKLKLGARMQLRELDSRNDISFVNPSGVAVKVPQLSSEYKNKDNVYAGYVTFSNKIKSFGYQLGLRAESSEYSGDVKTVISSGKDTAISYSNNQIS